MKKYLQEFKGFALSRATIGLLIFGLLYPIMMIGIYIPSYAHAGKSIDNITIAVVSEDTVTDNIAADLASQLSMKTMTDLSLDQAIARLDKKKIELIIHFPSDFSETPQVNYYTNATAAAMTRGVVTGLVEQIHSALDAEFGGSAGVGYSPILLSDTGKALQDQMGPMFLVIASYAVGLMLAAILVRMVDENRKKTGRFRSLIYAQILGLIIAFIAPLSGVLIFSAVSSASFMTLFSTWLILGCVTFASLQINFIIIESLGGMGQLLGAGVLLCNLMASGAIVSRPLMLAPFQWLSYVTPLFYAVDAIQRIMFGGVGIGVDIGILMAIIVVLIGCTFGVHALKTRNKKAKVQAQCQEAICGAE